MDFTNIMKFIPENLIIVIIAAYVFGVFLKRTESIKDKYITILLMIFTIIFSVIISGLKNNGTAILQGILCWGVAVGVDQTKKQLSKDE